MDQHNYQRARLKLFEDKRLKEVWICPKDGSKPFHKAASKCSTEKDFQALELEEFQRRIESDASRALRADGPWPQKQHDHITAWLALHILRNPKTRRDIFASREDWNSRFMEEYEKERVFSGYFNCVRQMARPADQFLITSDYPVVELWADLPDGEKHLVRCFAKSPNILVLLWGNGMLEPTFPISAEDYFNAMMWAVSDEFVYSHRNDVPIEKLKGIAQNFEMLPVEETIGFYVE
ncbi:MAG TPA: hypothetical protein VGI60_02930 [Chthoniobacterales bacterium]|jgi:hypothetical protein